MCHFVKHIYSSSGCSASDPTPTRRPPHRGLNAFLLRLPPPLAADAAALLDSHLGLHPPPSPHSTPYLVPPSAPRAPTLPSASSPPPPRPSQATLPPSPALRAPASPTAVRSMAYASCATWLPSLTCPSRGEEKEKELANAAGKLAECQKTIASLGSQLKSLADLDNVVLEPERLESRDMPLDFRNGDADFAIFTDELYDFDLPNGNGSCFSPLPSIQPASPPSEMSVFAGGLSSLTSYRSKRRK